MHLDMQSMRVRFPLQLIMVAVAISFVGVLNIYSAASAIRPNLYLFQCGWLAMGVVLCAICSFFPMRLIYRYSYILFAAVVLMLLLVLAVGIVAKGSQRWLNLGFMRIQPSELAKIAAIVSTARYLSDYDIKGSLTIRTLLCPFNASRPLVMLLGLLLVLAKKSTMFPWLENSILLTVGLVACILVTLGWLIFSLNQLLQKGIRLSNLIAPIDMAAIPFLLILVQPDLGTALIVLSVFGSIILFNGVNLKSLLLIIMGVIALSIGMWHTVLKDYQKQRVETFLNPETDLLGSGYQASQAIIAIGSGQILGKGFMEGTQTQLSFLPENHTDYAFAVLGEEWGFFGASFLMLLYLIFFIAILQIGTKIEDKFSALTVVGAGALIFWQLVMNAGMVTGLLPVVGVTFPLVSYGGASMMVSWMAIALCANASVWRKAK